MSTLPSRPSGKRAWTGRLFQGCGDFAGMGRPGRVLVTPVARVVGTPGPAGWRSHPIESVCPFPSLPALGLGGCAFPGQERPAVASGLGGGGLSASAAAAKSPRTTAVENEEASVLRSGDPTVITGTPGGRGSVPVALPLVAPLPRGGWAVSSGKSVWCSAHPVGNNMVPWSCAPAALGRVRTERSGRLLPVGPAYSGLPLRTFHLRAIQPGGSVMTSV